MTDWSHGYVSDVGYTFGYYGELNPISAQLALLYTGIVPPTETKTACELGFGQGLSVNFHAAAATTKWYGTDFNPAQAAFAKELADASGANLEINDEAFAEFARRPDLPDFDYIGVHGIWSWISDENRRVIVEFVRRKLKVGGVLYISYNTLPGWSAFAPMRHLITQHAAVIGAQGRSLVSRIDEALDFATQLLASNPAFLRANPQVQERFKGIKGQNRHYLAHEYFNRDWHPMHFGTMAEWLEPAKVQYACSAHFLDHIDAINLTSDQQNFLKDKIPDRMFRESVRDFMVNQQFRRDFWVKGVRRLSPLEQTEQLKLSRWVLTTHPGDVPLKVVGALGEAALSEAIYAPLLDAFSDHQPKSLREMEPIVSKKGINWTQLLQATLALAGSKHLAPVTSEAASPQARLQTAKLNHHIVQKAKTNGDINHLASPLTGGGILADRFHQLFILAITTGQKQPDEWATFVWNLFASQGQKVVKEGKILESPDENLAEINAHAKAFAEKRLPILKALQVV